MNVENQDIGCAVVQQRMQKRIHRVRDAHHVSGHRYSEIGERQLVGVILDDEDHRLGGRLLDAGAVLQTVLGI